MGGIEYFRRQNLDNRTARFGLRGVSVELERGGFPLTQLDAFYGAPPVPPARLRPGRWSMEVGRLMSGHSLQPVRAGDEYSRIQVEYA